MPKLAYYHSRKQRLTILVLAFSIVWSGLANAAVTVDNVSTEFDNNPNSLTTSHATSGTDRLMIVGVSMLNDDFETVVSVTYNGVNLNFVGSVARDDDSRVELWSYLNPPITTADVTVTFDDQVQDGAGIGIITFTGVDQTNPFGAFQSQTDESSTASINVTSATGELVLGVMAAERQDDSPSTTMGTQQWSYKVSKTAIIELSVQVLPAQAQPVRH
jgi:hypothetical protein